MKSRPSPRLLNLLRAHRKSSAFSQDEIAFLLGVQKGSKVSRYEQMARKPELKTALAFEAIFNCPVAELFPGLFEKVKAAVRVELFWGLVISASMPPRLYISIHKRTMRSERKNCLQTVARTMPSNNERTTVRRIYERRLSPS